MPIEYDVSREALMHPERQPTVFTAGQKPDLRLLAVEGARLAYIRADSDDEEAQRLAQSLALVGFERPAFHVDEESGAYCYCTLRKSDGLAMVSFRGSQPDNPSEVITDLNFLPSPAGVGRVHSGFKQASDALRPHVTQWLEGAASGRKRLLLCGHSLGAALATMFAGLVAPHAVITMGSPRVGDVDFIRSLPSQVVTRIVNCCDVVPTLPPGFTSYRHVGTLLYIDKDGKLHEVPESRFMLQDKISGQADHVWRLIAHRDFDGLPVRMLSDHAPINYVRAFA
ncbi:lipase family protein [Variovorax sp. J22R133]|uniref:lipase family protein n=1 Tax=Variovorax brevis TaxID=3053503 RepID=UPI00257653E9|nr:lipase family protein [Variovorax sp. J22R133]MDM0113836.1 lipase family protein [Variovorax sp. J22R133]